MPRVRRRGHAYTGSGLSGTQREILIYGVPMLCREGPDFDSDEHRRRSWVQHRSELLAESRPGIRPAAFFEFDLRESRIAWRWFDQIALLLKHGLIDPTEAFAIECEHHYLAQHVPVEFYFADRAEGVKRLFGDFGYGLQCHIRQMELSIAWHQWRNRPALIEVFERRLKVAQTVLEGGVK